MAIMAPADLPVVLRVDSDPLKKFALSKLGYPNVEVEIHEDQWESLLRVTGDFIAGYFPREQRMAVFHTTPLQSTYPMPKDAYWIQEVSWNPASTSVGDIFGAEAYLFNVGNIVGSGMQQMLTDFHLLQAYRRTSAKILSHEGHWEVIGEVDGGPNEQLIRLYPTPKGAFPVVVVYCPIITHFRSPQAKYLANKMLLAQAKIAVGNARRKIAGMPTPDGGSITYDGGDLVAEGTKEEEMLIEEAIKYGEPMGVFTW